MIIGNEEADDLAGVGSKSNFYGLEPCLPVPKSLMTPMTKEWWSGNHLSCWNLVSGCRQSKVWIKRLSDRSDNRTRPMGLLSDPTCAACGIKEESALHFIYSSKPKNSDFR
jgi:hypothetical protein